MYQIGKKRCDCHRLDLMYQFKPEKNPMQEKTRKGENNRKENVMKLNIDV